MYPDPFIIGPYTLHTYGILMFFGVVAGVFFFRILAFRSGIDPSRVTNVGIVVVFIGYFCAKFLYMITRLWSEGFSIEVAWDSIRASGSVWYGTVRYTVASLSSRFSGGICANTDSLSGKPSMLLRLV